VRIDVVTIFPDYLAPLSLSLPGKAQASGLLDLRVHDLRNWAHDRHRTVDDTPYGGGAGMVMKPEPWGAALDAITASPPSADPAVDSPVDPPADSRADSRTGGQVPLLVVPTPAGEPFTQRMAAQLARRPWLIFACGRYEGIDQRVVDDAAGSMDVREVSIGDYVLNGGEVAALVVTEAVVRLLPGFMGNASSLAEESHGDAGLLEYPVYTKPPTWRGHDVPPVLLTGDHGRIAAWRCAESLRRTAERRPDLLPATATVALDGVEVTPVLATRADAGELWTLQQACWLVEALANDTLDIPALHEDLEDVVEGLHEWRTYVVREGARLIASVRGRLDGDTWHVGRLMVAPDLRGRGIGRHLLAFVESQAPPQARRCELFTGAGSADNLRMYRRAGYRPVRDQPADRGVRLLAKRLH
jgi:tRNA (guanine37-N1)-methyltransferase